MTITEMLEQLEVGAIAGETLLGLFIILSLIQISPIRVNPWDHILGWFGKKINRETEEKLTGLDKRVTDIWINGHRQSILTFARECRSGIFHDSEEWAYILNVCEEYERFTEDHHVTNGVVKENTKYIRELYQRHSHDCKSRAEKAEG